jgi:glycosyltransferase involved in cell wall biosynthesis
VSVSPGVIGVVNGPPFDRRTWSGASAHLFTALRRHGLLEGAVDATPRRRASRRAAALTFHPKRSVWVERYRASDVHRAARSRRACDLIRAIDPTPDALLQIGAYFDFSRVHGVAPRLRSSFHDGNLQLALAYPGLVRDPNAPHIRRELAREREIFDALDLIMTMSDWLRRSFVDELGQPASKVVTVGSGANVRTLPTGGIRRDFSQPRFLFIGRQWHRKGGPELLRAFDRLHADRPDCELWIVGHDEPVDGQRTPGVRWLGNVDRRTPAGDATMDRLHREATAFVLPSHYDPMPNVVLEAMAYSLPCIGSDVCGIPEMVDAGVTGLLAPPGDDDALLACLVAFVDDPERARAMGARGRERVGAHFTWSRVAARMADAIGERLEAESDA